VAKFKTGHINFLGKNMVLRGHLVHKMSGHPNLSYPMASTGAVETELHKVPETKAMATFQETKSQNPYLHPLACFKLGHVAWSCSNSKLYVVTLIANFFLHEPKNL
jgi:hypothetical protein